MVNEQRPLTPMGEHWEEHAEEWAAWAREPDHDSFWHFNGQAFLSLLPAAPQRVLDLGCGEGRLSRELKRLGHSVVGIDAAPTMVRLAREQDPEGDYRVADAAELPFPDNSFEVVAAFMALMDVDDMSGAVSESARVLQSGGHLVMAVSHPINDAGRFESQAADARFLIEGSYFGKRRWEDRVERDGFRMHFLGWAYPLATYAAALEQAGLLIEAIREPVPPEALAARLPGYHRWRRVPLFLHIRALKQ